MFYKSLHKLEEFMFRMPGKCRRLCLMTMPNETESQTILWNIDTSLYNFVDYYGKLRLPIPCDSDNMMQFYEETYLLKCCKFNQAFINDCYRNCDISLLIYYITCCILCQDNKIFLFYCNNLINQ